MPWGGAAPGCGIGGFGGGSAEGAGGSFYHIAGDARSTQDEAAIVTRYLKEQQAGVDKILLVSSKFHSNAGIVCRD